MTGSEYLLARCREVLREVEWRTPLPYEQCPSCRGVYADHSPDCKLAAVLKELEEK